MNATLEAKNGETVDLTLTCKGGQLYVMARTAEWLYRGRFTGGGVANLKKFFQTLEATIEGTMTPIGLFVDSGKWQGEADKLRGEKRAYDSEIDGEAALNYQ